MLHLSSLQWIAGPALPFGHLHSAKAVQLEDTFVLVGGLTKDHAGLTVTSDAVLEFDNVNGSWVVREERLSRPRADHYAVLVEEQFCL